MYTYLIFGYFMVNIYPFLNIFDKITKLYIFVRLFGNTYQVTINQVQVTDESSEYLKSGSMVFSVLRNLRIINSTKEKGQERIQNLAQFKSIIYLFLIYFSITFSFIIPCLLQNCLSLILLQLYNTFSRFVHPWFVILHSPPPPLQT